MKIGCTHIRSLANMTPCGETAKFFYKTISKTFHARCFAHNYYAYSWSKISKKEYTEYWKVQTIEKIMES